MVKRKRKTKGLLPTCLEERPVYMLDKVSKTLDRYDKGKATCKDLHKMLVEIENFYES